jgi:hypothetical protein
MPPTLLHQFWTFISETQTAPMLNLDDAALSRWLLRQFQRQNVLDSEQTKNLNTYITERLPLIRELAQERWLAYS